MNQAGTAIRFGTDGWRGVIADTVTFANVARVTEAYGRWLTINEEPGARVLVGYDTRFLSEAFARTAASTLMAAGHQAWLTPGPAPTPAISWAVHQEGLAGALMVTASHNPSIYNGIKIKASYGGPALPEMTSAVEALLPSPGAGPAPAGAPAAATQQLPGVLMYDPRPAYLAQLARLVDLSALAEAKLRIVGDMMHGAAGGYLVELFRDAGMDYTEVRGSPDPLFGGVHPEPLPPNLQPLFDAVNRLDAHVGLATDGDGDRIGAVDPEAGFVDAQQIFALLLQHLVEVRGWRGMVVKTYAGTRMVQRLAEQYGLPYQETPVGFKHVCRLALEQPVLIGGEESGGIGVMNHLPERDGLLCALLLLEIMAARGKSLAGQVQALMDQVGPHYYARRDLPLPGPGPYSLEPLLASPPARIASFPVAEVETTDGVKLLLGDPGWVLFRMSGTEPLLRVYAEMESEAALTAVLIAAARLAEELIAG